MNESWGEIFRKKINANFYLLTTLTQQSQGSYHNLHVHIITYWFSGNHHVLKLR